MAQNKKNNYKDNEFVKNNEPFKNDLLGREKIAQLWQDTLLKSGKHFVMAVDASWGMGKSYFARNWECKLLKEDYHVCYIDAFEYDFTDDPFMTISSSIIETLKINNNFTELEEISNYLGVLYKSLKTNSLNLFGSIIEGATQIVLGAVDSTCNNSIINGVAKVAGNVVNIFKDSLKKANKSDINPVLELTQKDITYNHVIQAFKILLENKVRDIIKDSNKPFIVIVDELDRCKPTFAIEFLEKLKHLFDIPNMIFILFINEKELASAINHTYGVNGSDYLGKFIQVSASLNFKNSISNNLRDYYLKYAHTSNEYFDIDENNYFFEVTSIFERLRVVYPTLSLREVDNIVECANLLNIKGFFNLGLFYTLKVIQLKDKKLYAALRDPSILNEQYDIVMPNLFKDIDDLEVKYGKIIGCFILLCYNIGTSSRPFQEYKSISDTTQNKNIEKILQKHGYLYTGIDVYAEYLCQLVELADLNM